jgi:hypothetical protein
MGCVWGAYGCLGVFAFFAFHCMILTSDIPMSSPQGVLSLQEGIQEPTDQLDLVVW